MGAAVLPLLALTLGPWLGFAPVRASQAWAGSLPASSTLDWPDSLRRDPQVSPDRAGRPGGCNCRKVVLNMKNFVSDAKVKTGDAKVVNFNVTYVSASFGDREVEVDQEAEALSGDAIAGQLIGVDARGPTCVNVEVRAVNRVVDSVVESGSATAINRSIVLLDPGVSRGDLEIDIEQEAEAHSGDAIAGQVIGLTAGGGSSRCRSSVDLDAVNEVRDTKVRTGEASFSNFSDIRRCAVTGCAAELRALLGEASEFELCSVDRCRGVDMDELTVALAEESKRRDDRSDDEDEDPEVAVASEESSEASTCDAPPPTQPAPSPAASAAPAASASPSPSPSPSPEPSGPPTAPTTAQSCPSPEPEPTPSPGLLAVAEQEETPPAG